MKRTLSLLLSAWLFNLSVSAQNSGHLKGEIHEADNQVATSANISLLKVQDSLVVKMAITDLDGKFEMEDLPNGLYVLAVSSLGAKKYYSAPLSISEANATLDLGIITLQNDEKLLQGVTVTARKPYIERKMDRTIVNVDALISNAGSTAWEVLGTSPGVRTDDEGNVILKGKGGVVVFIDDKPTYLSGDALMNYLKSLPSGTIDKIELMTNPPAKYDAAGGAGVINIRTKKGQLRGFNGGFTLSYGQGFYPKSNNSFNMNYRTGKLNLFTVIGANYNESFNDLYIERRFSKVDGSYNGAFGQQSDIKHKSYGANIKLGMDYYLSPKTTLGVVGTGLLGPSSGDILNTGLLSDSQHAIDSILIAKNTDEDNFKNAGINFNFRHQFDSTGRELTFDADYIKYKNKTEQLFQNRVLHGDSSLISEDDLIGSVPSDINIYTVKADYAHPFKNALRFETGAKASQIETDNTANYSNRVNNITTPNYDLSNHFIYKENIYAAYVNMSKEWKKLSMQAGLRLEHTQSRGNQLGNVLKPDSTFNRSYTNLFPTLYLAYKPDSLGNHEFNLNYGRRIERPIFEDLNPFVSPLDKLTFYVGNPFLRPQFAHNIDFSYTYKGFLTISCNYGLAQNMVAETIEIIGTNYYSRPNNIGENITRSVNASATFNPFKFWTCSLYAELSNQIFRGTIYTEQLDVNKTYGFFNVNNQFQFGKGWSGELSGFYQTNAPYAQLTILSRGQMNVGVQKKILNNKGTLKLSVRDFTYSFVNSGRINYVQQAEGSWRNKMDSRVVTVSFSYNFSQGYQNQNNRRTGGADDEKNRVKNQ